MSDFTPCLDYAYGPLDPTLDLSGDFFSGFKAENRKEIIVREVAFYKELHAPYSVENEIETKYSSFISSDGAKIPVKLYRPKNRETELLPLLVFYHGGGFITCSIETHDFVPSYLAAKGNLAVMSVDYRLAPEYPFPLGLEDSYQALEWAYANAEKLKIDDMRISVGGDSSGGNFAAVLCHLTRDRKGPPVASQVLIYPAVELSGTVYCRSVDEYPPVGSNSDNAVDFAGMYCSELKDLSNPLVSPLLAKNFASLPPALILQAEYDPLRDSGLMYGQKLREADVPVSCHIYKGMPHAFVLRTFNASFKALNQICMFLSKKTGESHEKECCSE